MHLLKSYFKAGNLRDDRNMEEFIFFFLGKYNPYDHGTKPIFKFLDTSALRQELMDCDRSPRSIVAILLENWARNHGKKRWGDKTTTRYAFEIEEMYSMFPRGKFIFVHRDPRGVCHSLMNAGWTKNYLEAAYMWHYLFRNTMKGLSAVSASQRFEVRYEDICVMPREKLSQLCSFLGEEYAPEMFEYFKKSDEVIANIKIEEIKRNVERELIKNNYLKWRNHLSKEVMQTLEFVNSSFMRLCGYSTESESEHFTIPENLIQLTKVEFNRRQRVRARSLYDHLLSLKK